MSAPTMKTAWSGMMCGWLSTLCTRISLISCCLWGSVVPGRLYTFRAYLWPLAWQMPCSAAQCS